MPRSCWSRRSSRWMAGLSRHAGASGASDAAFGRSRRLINLKSHGNRIANTDARTVALAHESPQCGLADKQLDQHPAKGAPLMTAEGFSAPGVRVIVVANEKGGSGKSTVAIHLAIALLRSGQSVASIDLDAT